MKSAALSVICLTALFASTAAIAQRGLSSGPSSDQSSAPSDTRVAQQQGASVDPGELFRDCDNCPELVVVPPGDFVMGSNDTPYEKPEHLIRIPKPFAIGRREVTFAEWDPCVDAGACKVRPEDHGWGRGDRPVINVSWEDTKLYVAWLSQKTGQKYRLPSEAEWEYAARAGTRTPFWWGKEAGVGHAQCDGCGSPIKQQVVPVGSFRPNGFGLYDTSGNAAEWVEDCWNDSYRNAPKDALPWTSGDCRLRVLRGGNFLSKVSDVRSSARFRYDVDVRYYANGFRVVRELP
ncbi:formylglycine-generating enzyme family protein [Bradyrhizobium sp. Gha]|uniref:formylglycine-generating enzyme family protein n=1 Tax=Bradyrhizobium sp. Gha TaxID=1855318 RepID=UPI000B806406|nr:formylglycine-generating enzyme family protein [Bradyrhizobium sp. Gha]